MKFTVRVEFDVQSTDLLDVEVNAEDREEAIKKAIQKVRDGEISESERYASDHLDSTMSDNYEDWIVDED